MALGFVLAATHASIGTVVPFGSGASVRFLFVGAIFLAGVVAYLPAYFRPLAYHSGRCTPPSWGWRGYSAE